MHDKPRHPFPPGVPVADQAGNIPGMPSIGDTIGVYTIRKLLGQGGMAAVYLAESPSFSIAKALKVHYPTNDPDAVTRFFNEAALCSHLEHANIVKVYHFELLNSNQPYAVMELMNGTVEELLKDNVSFSPGMALSVLQLITSALEYAHRQTVIIKEHKHSGLIHRDIKPANILFSSDGTFKLGDFGLAKIGSINTTTARGVVLGTTPYLAPEQHYEWTATVQTDIYALGVTLYEMLTGTRPFPETGIDSYAKLIAAKAHGEYDSLARKGVQGAVDIEKIIEKCLHPDPSKRFQTYGLLRGEIEKILEKFQIDHPEKVARLYITNSTMYKAAYEQSAFKPRFKFAKPLVFVLLVIVTIGVLSGVMLKFKSGDSADSPYRRYLVNDKQEHAQGETEAVTTLPDTAIPTRTDSKKNVRAVKVPDNRSLRNDSPVKATVLKVASEQFNNGEYAACIATLEKTTIDANCPDSAVLMLMEAHYKAENFADVVLVSKRKLVNDTHYFLFLALCYSIIGKKDQALDYFDRAISAPSLYRKSSKYDAMLLRARYLKRLYSTENDTALQPRLLDAWGAFAQLYCRDLSPECDEAQAVLSLKK